MLHLLNNRKIFNFIILCQFALYRNLPAPGLGAKPGASKDADKKKFRPDDYIIPPKVPQMSMAKLKVRPMDYTLGCVNFAPLKRLPLY